MHWWIVMVGGVSLFYLTILILIAICATKYMMEKRLLLFKAPSYNKILQMKVEGQFNKILPPPPPPGMMKELEMVNLNPNPMMGMKKYFNQNLMNN